MKRWVLSLAALAAVIFIAAPVHAAKEGEAPQKAATQAEVGKPAPDFSVTDAEGKAHSLADGKGKVQVLIWHNPDCPFVVRHMKADTYNKLRSEFPADKVSILLIDSSNYVTADKAKASAAENKLTVPVGLDAEGKVGHLYGAKTTPHVFVIDKDGKLVYDGAIDNDASGNKPAAEVENYASAAIKSALAGEAVKTASTKPYGCSVKYAKQQAAAPAIKLQIELTGCGGSCGDKKTSTSLMTVAGCGGSCGDKKTTTSLTVACGDSCGGDKGKDGTKDGKDSSKS